MRVLGIETSCDETGVGIVDAGLGVVGEALSSQIELHRRYGGVVPEIASRDHLRKLMPVVDEALAGGSLRDIDAIGYTAGPGLIGALLVGAVTAHALGWALEKPVLGVHHMEAHLLTPMLFDNRGEVDFPFLGLLVSGGHTLLVKAVDIGDYVILGTTQDDAAGEAFDKVAKILGLPYPGGPQIEKLAAHGDAERFAFPRPMERRKDCHFSFSGLKTHTMRTYLQLQNPSEQDKADIAAGFQAAAIDALLIKCRRAADQSGVRTLVVSGGVSANLRLRSSVAKWKEQGITAQFPDTAYCTDNGVMIAHLAMLRLLGGQQPDREPMTRARWPLDQLAAPDST